MKTKLDMLEELVEGVDKAVGDVAFSKDYYHVDVQDMWELVQLYTTLRKNGAETQAAFNEVRKIAGLT